MKKTMAIISASAALIALSSSFSVSAAPAAAMEFTNAPTGLLLADIDISPKKYELKISLNKKKVTSKVGKKVKLKAATNIDGYEVTYKSTNKKVATVKSDGTVKLKKKGKAKIVAKCNGVESTCKITVKKKNHVLKSERNSVSDGTMSSIASAIGCQTDYAYGESTIMCSAYSYAYAYYQVTGVMRSARSFWIGGAGCNWDGGTYSRYGSSSEMLSAIKSQLDQNKACVGLMSTSTAPTHYVTFYSYDGNGDSLSDFKVVDPWDGVIYNASTFGYSYDGYHVVTVNA